jgi:hypothetical protein
VLLLGLPLFATGVLTGVLASSDQGWSVPVKGLQVRVDAPSGTHKIKDRVELTLRFRNAAKEPVRIYLIVSEPFRAFQSSLWAWDRKGGLVSSQPELHPHGSPFRPPVAQRVPRVSSQ